MAGVSWRFTLDRTASDSVRQRDVFAPKDGPVRRRISGIQTPEAVGGHASDDELDRLVNHAFAFNNSVLEIIDLGEGIPPIAVVEGEHPIGNARCAEHKAAGTYPELTGPYPRRAVCDACEHLRTVGKPDLIRFVLNGGSYATLAGALVAALALRDRGNPNDARYTAASINRLLSHEGDDWK